ncbi:segregation/condensation protein A [archaeon]|jgi:segregation and condensation protein A|nr:segregation/condensation protein A [archaeon]MBT6761793.1 segregation/condensation protein A [archaeon]
MQEHIEHIVLKHSDIDWKNLLVDLVNKEGMDPWDIDITELTKTFIKTVQKMQEADLKVSGKMFLAAAMLFKLKSHHLLEHDITMLDQLLNDNDEEEFDDDYYDTDTSRKKRNLDPYTLIRRNPQPRRRKVSIHDLVEALQKAMKTRKRKLTADRPNYDFKMPEGSFDVTNSIRELLNKITYYTKKKEQETLTFTSLLPPRAGKQEKVHTFIPLLHLSNEKKIDTTQEKPFDEIYLRMYSEKHAKKKAKSEALKEKKLEEAEIEAAKEKRKANFAKAREARVAKRKAKAEAA